jgi:hypothetical protein
MAQTLFLGLLLLLVVDMAQVGIPILMAPLQILVVRVVEVNEIILLVQQEHLGKEILEVQELRLVVVVVAQLLEEAVIFQM